MSLHNKRSYAIAAAPASVGKKIYKSKIIKNSGKLNVLLNNAGIMQTPYFKTKDGLERQMGVNHFGHFKLTGLLMDLINNTNEKNPSGKF